MTYNYNFNSKMEEWGFNKKWLGQSKTETFQGTYQILGHLGLMMKPSGLQRSHIALPLNLSSLEHIVFFAIPNLLETFLIRHSIVFGLFDILGSALQLRLKFSRLT